MYLSDALWHLQLLRTHCYRLSIIVYLFAIRTLRRHNFSNRIVSHHDVIIVGLNEFMKAVETIRYDTRCYFNVRSKADTSQLNLPHGDWGSQRRK